MPHSTDKLIAEGLRRIAASLSVLEKQFDVQGTGASSLDSIEQKWAIDSHQCAVQSLRDIAATLATLGYDAPQTEQEVLSLSSIVPLNDRLGGEYFASYGRTASGQLLSDISLLALVLPLSDYPDVENLLEELVRQYAL